MGFNLILMLLLVGISNGYSLQVGFYSSTCPNAEKIVRDTVSSYFADDSTVSAPLLRLHFHDCFVRGCDGSVLLNSTETNVAEKDARPNKSLDAFYVIDAAKAALENACPGVVSCADILALAARDAVTLAVGPLKGSGKLWEVETGRRDGSVSNASEAVAHLPSASADFEELKSDFALVGLSVKDLTILSGAHTIGNGHCGAILKRLYNFTGNGDMDPTLDPTYANFLKSKCQPGDTTTVLEMDPNSSTSFDTSYYKLVVEKKGLFHSDEALLQNKESLKIVESYSKPALKEFLSEFGVSMVNMGRISVLSGDQGEIRKNCALVN
ncbi:hypothetical protein LUZ60_010704 [Juncus effusus]|nr:hypothetical protein LUZ60_010704 [Juncus effusus]